jgi:hypothetical protein
MKTTILYIILLLLPGSVLLSSSKKTDQFQLKVIKGNETIGLIQTSEVIQNGKVAYFLQSSVDVNVLLKMNIMESISDVFEGNQLTHSVHARYINGKIKAGNELKLGPAGYELNTNEKQVKHLNELITRSVLSLYYHEPVDGVRVYSQSFGAMIEVQKIGAGKYCLELPNGNTSTYTYEKGLLQSVESQTIWGTITFLREK